MRVQWHVISLLVIVLLSEMTALAAFGEKPAEPTVSRVEVVLAHHYRGGSG